MTAQVESEVVLYDLACIRGVCFSPVVWRIRLMLNYKRIPYRTIFLEFPDIEPTMKALGVVPGESSSSSQYKYTVPVIHHIPSNMYIMESMLIAQFLESTYPDPPVPLTTELGREIISKSRDVVGPAFRASVMPREIGILSPRAQEYFRRTREASLGCRLEDKLSEEEQSWKAVGDSIGAVVQLMQTHKAEGPFVLGARPTYADFTITGSLQSARIVDESVFQRIFRHSGYKEIYEACLPYMEKQD
ncbi:hypothetical protein N7510_002736 [Penicillium lagena]|uniref:uncharacterized protein n=1 Tax=Penicillium lagena TaxID=94218 RepID=UPI0025409365|nr:uncharacterized protein N7510_002736 [Penicillium lagena]KAJ5618752.1 hypothetical protein N7510_002736 [Penicillium lagena]